MKNEINIVKSYLFYYVEPSLIFHKKSFTEFENYKRDVLITDVRISVQKLS